MNQIPTSVEKFFHELSEKDVRLRQNSLEDNEARFLYTCAKMLLHKRLRVEKLLSLYTIPFCSITDANQIKTDSTSMKNQEIPEISKEA